MTGKYSGRYLAHQVLDRFETKDAYANLALQEVLNESGAGLDRRERAFCTELVYGTLRHLYKIDHILGRLLSRPLASSKISVKNLLRLALYQLAYLPEIPERAVCHSAVDEIKNSKYQALAPMVNGVLRAYIRNKDVLSRPISREDLAQYLTIEYSHPAWLVEKWLRQFGAALTEQVLQVNNQQPPLTLRVNRHIAQVDEVTSGLQAHGIEWAPGRFLDEAITVKSLAGVLEETPGFTEGKYMMQDESSMLVAHLLNPSPKETIVDLCAAPGGKSTHLAELMNDQGRIISIDQYQHKVDLIKANAERLHLRSLECILHDARDFQIPGLHRQADAVLLDAPCSGTGVLRRRVDARYRRKPEDIQELAALQRSILKNAATLVRPGGRLIYSTCALEAEENHEQIKWFLSQYPEYQLTDYKDYLPETITRYLADPSSKWVTLLPVRDGGDGFFMCRLDRRINP